MHGRTWMGIRRAVSISLALGALLTASSKNSWADPATPRPDLTGTVKDTDGKPLPQATIFIYTAGPKEGVSVFCPSCYAGCRNHATTDPAGHFKIESLDPSLIFRVLVVGKGRQPKFVAKVDPA